MDTHQPSQHQDPRPGAERVVRAFWQSYSHKDLDSSFDKYISKDLIVHGMDGSGDRESWLAADKAMMAAFDDFTLTVLDQIADADTVTTHIKVGGTHTGEFLGVPASGTVTFLAVTSMDRVDGAQIVEHWVEAGFPSFLQKLSAPPASKRRQRVAPAPCVPVYSYPGKTHLRGTLNTLPGRYHRAEVRARASGDAGTTA